MTDDPWRKPDPSDPGPPPGYVPPPNWAPPAYGPAGNVPHPTYGQPPYGPAGSQPYNPYQAPAPKPGSIGRLVWILCTAGLLLLGGCGVGIFYLAKSVTKNADEVNSFLRSVRNQQFDSAYKQLCPSAQSRVTESDFTAALAHAAAFRYGVGSYDITSSRTSGSGIGTQRSASGYVTFFNGSPVYVTFHLQKQGGHLCILDGFTALYLN